MLAAVYGDDVPQTVAEKKELLHRYRVALWDVIASCRITGSADSSISEVQANDLRPLLAKNPIGAIVVNGKTAARYYKRLIEPVIGRPAVCLPSTSPANAACSLQELVAAWRVIAAQ